MDASPYPIRYDLPQPNRLHWGWVLAANLLSRNYFNFIWLVVQASWIKKATGRRDVLWWAIANMALLPIAFLVGITAGIVAITSGARDINTPFFVVAIGLFVILTLVIYSVTIFKMRAALEAEPIGIPLGPVKTFFLGSLYFQYFLKDYVFTRNSSPYGASGISPQFEAIAPRWPQP